ncbi:MAG: ribosomal RNA small subunit methyltransferase A [Deltaproteobacteria bacterium]|nr:ribosomal RNA small subunit methyltransferase A [Deltaproteobacteria bacterium]
MPGDDRRDNPPPHPKKRFGQNFLTDRNLIRKIVATGGVKENDIVLEVGPGRGALTEGLLEAGAKVIAIEADKDLADILKARFPSDRFSLIMSDALKVSFSGIAEEYKTRLKTVSNLPYNISGPILTKFINERKAFTLLVLMFQKEVAERIVARPGTKDYGILSVLSQVWADVKIEFHVSRNLFKPRPKVDSSIVSFKILDEPKVRLDDEEFFKSVVKSAFGTRRKMLSNALGTLGLDRELVFNALAASGIDPKRRGETLTLQEFGTLANTLLQLTP